MARRQHADGIYCTSCNNWKREEKSAYSYLESLPEEKRMVQHLYEIFRTTRSIQTTAKQMNEEGFHTPSGAAFNSSTTRLVLRNSIYCTADKRSYDYSSTMMVMRLEI